MGSRLLPPPFSQLLPGLDQLLHSARRRKGVAVDDPALAIRSVVELADSEFAQKREVVHDFLQVLTTPGLFFVSGVWTPSRNVAILPYSPFVRQSA